MMHFQYSLMHHVLFYAASGFQNDVGFAYLLQKVLVAFLAKDKKKTSFSIQRKNNKRITGTEDKGSQRKALRQQERL